MKHLKTFEKYVDGSIGTFWSSDADTPTFDPDELDVPEDDHAGMADYQVVMDTESSRITDFGYSVYGVYLYNDGRFFYVGDVRRMDNFDELRKIYDVPKDYNGNEDEYWDSQSPREYLSYLRLDRMSEREVNPNIIEHAPQEVIDLVEKDMERTKISTNLMDDMPKFRKVVKDKLAGFNQVD